jgi:hypothetical protein
VASEQGTWRGACAPSARRVLTESAERAGGWLACAIAACALAGCKSHDRPEGPELALVGESARYRSGDALPATTPWYDGQSITMVAARGETLGIQVWHTAAGAVTLAIDGARVETFATTRARVVRPSTGLYGGSHGVGDYPDGLVAEAAPTSDPVYVTVAATGEPGKHRGELVVGARRLPVVLDIDRVTLPPLPLGAWAYYDPRELQWAHLGSGTLDAPSAEERACIAMFRTRGVLLSPDLPSSAWPARQVLLDGSPFVPAAITDDPNKVGDDVRAWIAATQGTGQVPFAIPIDEPSTDAARERVRTLADAARAAGAGAGRFLFAVTDEPREVYGDAIDLYLTLRPKQSDRFPRWTYNGAPPRAGAMVVDAEAPGPRTWGWISWRWRIPLWYAWDALYWHDRHNRHKAPLPGRLLEAAKDAVSFDDGDDHGNLDGVLALPGDAAAPCRPTLRLEALRRGIEDHQLLDLAAACAPDQAAKVAERLVPRALGDADGSVKAAWPTDDAAWEHARRELLAIASRCAR